MVEIATPSVVHLWLALTVSIVTCEMCYRMKDRE